MKVVLIFLRNKQINKHLKNISKSSANGYEINSDTPSHDTKYLVLGTTVYSYPHDL